ncbi:MAG: histidinol dehydrogenase [Bacteroides sp. SM23_62_1]|nr:MAG: histidinol dehydrogenase [Bacteroides sp. SM23_62_1]
MKIYKYPSRDTWPVIMSRPVLNPMPVREQVSLILKDIREKGDEAVRHYTRQYDKVNIQDFRIPSAMITKAGVLVEDELKKAIAIAQKNIRKFHEKQITFYKPVVTSPGTTCWLRTEPIEKVGLYIPGGSAPLISTVLMLGIPARQAGCQEIILCTPPDRNGDVHPAILYTAGILGIDRIFRVGGVQAIGAMAYGTESVPAVYKIFGPGNQYVTTAKQLVALEGVSIDFPAGPSEVAIIADSSANPAFVASDLLAQAEHGSDSQVLLATNHEPLLKAVQDEIERQLRVLPRRSLVQDSLSHCQLVLMPNLEEIIEIINAYAPEHVIIMTTEYNEHSSLIRNAGSVFLGQYSPVSAGDYVSGTNHTLPTNGYARAYSGIRVDSFQKVISFQEITRSGLINLAPAIEQLAKAESLLAHRNAITVRLK